MKNKSGLETTKNFKSILQQCQHIPSLLWVDSGKEFLNSNFKSLLKSFSITLYVTESKLKCFIIESLIRDIKLRFSRIRSKYNITPINLKFYMRYVTKLNNQQHSEALGGLSPKDAKNDPNNISFLQHLYFKKRYLKAKKFKNEKKLKRGYYVRALVDPFVFTRATKPRFSKKIYQIKKVLKTTPVTYLLSSGSPRAYYNQQLTRVLENVEDKHDENRIIAILGTRDLPQKRLRSNKVVSYEKQFYVITNQDKNPLYISASDFDMYINGKEVLKNYIESNNG